MKNEKHNNDDNDQDEDNNEEELKQNAYKIVKDEKGRDAHYITPDGSVRKIYVTENLTSQPTHILGRIWINSCGKTSTNKIFEEYWTEERDFILGQAHHAKGIEMALSTMRIGEHAIIEIYDPKYSYNDNKCPNLCPKNKTNENEKEWPLIFEIIVIDSMPKEKSSHEMGFIEQLKYAQLLREKGNTRYNKQRFLSALRLYNRAIQCLEAMKDMSQIPKEELNENINESDIQQEKLRIYLNSAICHINVKDYHQGLKDANKALEIDPNSKKGLLRRSSCYRELADYHNAKQDIKKISRNC